MENQTDAHISSGVRVGVIGTGGMGGRHARNLSGAVAGAEVTAVMDPDEANLRRAAVETGAAHTFTDAAALVAHDDVDAVVIASPDRFHAATARLCVEHRKPVLCEKPLATTAADAYQVVEAEKAAGRRLVQLGFMREYDPAHLAVKRVLEAGTLGPTLYFRGVHVNPSKHQLRTVEDVISNSVVHDVHSARWLMGEEIEQVFASTLPGAPDRPDTARFALVQLRFASGALGTIECNSEAGYGYEVDVKITADDGSAETSSLSSAVVSHASQRARRVEDDWLQRFETAYLDEARDWVRSVRERAPRGPSAWDGYVSMVVCDACIASAKSGAPVRVELPPAPDIYGGEAPVSR